MLIVIGATLAIGVVVLSLLSLGRRGGVLERGSVSTQWLAEHREYQDGGRSR
jgi:hypothetical protein